MSGQCLPPPPSPSAAPRSNVLPPGLSNIAFIGQLATFAHVLTAALQSRWLVGVLAGEVALPPLPDRVADVEKQQAHWRKFPVPRSNNYVWAQVRGTGQRLGGGVCVCRCGR